MKLGDVFLGCDVENYNKETEIGGISSDSRKVKAGDLFICISGAKRDGHDFAAEAVQRGAVCVLGERMTDSPIGTALTPSTRRAESRVWYNFTENPTERMKTVAVTGTAGKSSVVFILRHLLQNSGYKVGCITTLGAYSGKREIRLGENGGSSVADIAGAMTTPDPEYFFGAAREMVKDGCDVLLFEASSQALALEKLSAVSPDIAVFTNVSRDHLDFHQTMEEYTAAKCKLFEHAKAAVINGDDEWLTQSYKKYPHVPGVICSAFSEKIVSSDVCALRILEKMDGVEYVYFSEKAVFRVRAPLLGRFSVYNTMEAVTCALMLGCDPMSVKESLQTFGGISGRMYRVCEGEELPTVIIDYAHTPDALRAVLSALKTGSKNGRLIVVFGCGGDRDRGKRPLMANVVSEYADYVIVTSDNPRFEDPVQIMGDILQGIRKGTPTEQVPDRREAIRRAVQMAAQEDTVLLAGKGHEKYEIIGGSLLPFDEERCAREALLEKKNEKNSSNDIDR